MRTAAAITLIVSLPYGAHAFSLERAEPKFREGHYELILEAQLDAPLADVSRVLSDYERYPQLDDRVETAEIIERNADGTVVLYTELEACLSFMCRTVERYETVEQRDDELLAVVLADVSDLSYGRTRTRLIAVDSMTTRVIYETSAVPKFWVPRFARRSMLRTLRDATVELFEHVEAVAQQGAQPSTP